MRPALPDSPAGTSAGRRGLVTHRHPAHKTSSPLRRWLPAGNLATLHPSFLGRGPAVSIRRLIAVLCIPLLFLTAAAGAETEKPPYRGADEALALFAREFVP